MSNMINDNKKGMDAMILASADALLRKHGIRAVTMDDIATELAISKKTIYQYFDSKTTLINAVVAEYIIQKTAELNKAAYDASNAIEQVFLSWYAMEDFFQVIDNDALDQLKRYSPAAFNSISEFKNNFLRKYFKTNIETGITEELYRENINPDILASYALEMISVPVNINTLSRGKLSFIDAEDQMLSYHLHAIATPKGISLVKKYQQELLAHKTYFK